MKSHTIALITILILVGVTACGSTEPAGPTNTPTLVPTATNTPLPTETPPPTFTPTPEPSPTPEFTQDELKEIYQPMIGNGLLLYSVCPLIVDTAERRQSGELDGFGALGEIFVEATILDGINTNLQGSTATGQQGDFVSDLQGYTDVMKDVLAQWFNDQITSVDVPGLLADTCPAVEESLQEIVDAARADGMSDETLDLILTEYQDALEEMGGGS
ncbi:hypothetical protein KQH61_00690 [bacterium]|nr:hypothetical protein [bacterium]